MRTGKPLALALIAALATTAAAEVPPTWQKPDDKAYAFDAVAGFFDTILAKDAKAAAKHLRFDDSFAYVQKLSPTDAKQAKACKKLTKVKKAKSFKTATKCLFHSELIRAIEATQKDPGMLARLTYVENAADLPGDNGVVQMVQKQAKKELAALDDEHGFVLADLRIPNDLGFTSYDVLIAVSSEMNMDERAIGGIFGFAEFIEEGLPDDAGATDDAPPPAEEPAPAKPTW